WEVAVGRLVVVAGEGQLLELVRAGHAGGGLADLLDRRQQQADQDCNDGNDHQQLDQREGFASLKLSSLAYQREAARGYATDHERDSCKRDTTNEHGGRPAGDRPISSSRSGRRRPRRGWRRPRRRGASFSPARRREGRANPPGGESCCCPW